MSRRQRQTSLTAFLIGLITTAVVIGLHLAGGLDWIELKTLDLRFRHANSIPEHPLITCIDIDDASLQKVGRWPWPRDEQAGMLAVLDELEARAVLVDLTFSEPQPVRPRVPPNVDIVTDPLELTAARLELLFPDDELQAAIAALGNVYLAVHYDPDAWDQSQDFQDIVTAIQTNQDKPTTQLTQAARVVLALQADILLDDLATAEQLDLELPFVRRVFERCRQFVLRSFVRRQLSEHPEWWRQPPSQTIIVLYKGLTARPYEGETSLKAALCVAFRDVLGYQATMHKQLALLENVREIAVAADAIVPVYFTHARAARSCGFVAFEPDADGITRRNALFARHEDHVLGQLAFTVACDVLDIPPEGISVRNNRLKLQSQDSEHHPLILQLDRQGRLIMPWLKQKDWTKQFGRHIPADALWMIADRRRQLAQNERLLKDSRYTLFAGGLFENNDEYRQKLQEITRAESAAHTNHQTTIIEDIERELVELERQTVERLQRELQQATTQPALTATVDDLQFILKQVAALDELAARISTANAGLQSEIDETLAWLRPRIEGQICLIGYTATSLADMTPIPTHKRAPGVIAHANLLNGLLTRRLVGWAPPLLNIAITALLGIIASFLSVTRSPRVAGVWILILLVAFVGGAGWGAFYAYTYWIVLTPAIAAMLTSYLAIGVYRYIFLDRERRQLTTALSQYTSATLARQMADNPELCRRAETREVTAMFTDLRGFTLLSERIGAERTQHILNLYLGRSSQIMLLYEAMINKFIGDGIFAFWNPVIYPQKDHAELACQTAVDLLAGLQELAQEQQRMDGDEAVGELFMRIGVATGKAVVGPCGSEQKYDYTCIGDSVNVAARLESANRFYGTRTLISGATRAQVSEQFEFRRLGGVQVKGKRQAVPIFELLGRSGQIPDPLREYAQEFGQAVTLFQNRDWSASRAAFESCRQQRPEDLAADRYLSAINQFKAQSPPSDWNGSIELLEK